MPKTQVLPKQVVVLGPDTPRTAVSVERYEKLVAQNGNEVLIKWVDSGLPAEQQVAEARDAIAIIPAATKVFTSDLIRQLPNLRLVQTTSAGTDWIDRGALGEMGVLVANNNGGNAPAVAEHAIALMVTMYRRLDLQFASVKARHWAEDCRGRPEDFHTLVGKTVGIIGLGRIGSRVARRLAGWECEIIYYDTAQIPPEVEREAKATRVELDELLRRSDIVTLHVPLDRITHHMISTRELKLMKSTAILINTCRGPAVDEAALIEALKSGEIYAAGLDVTEVEPTPADNPLLDLPNVVVTPHIATRAIESTEASMAFAISNVCALARGEQPASVVPPV